MEALGHLKHEGFWTGSTTLAGVVADQGLKVVLNSVQQYRGREVLFPINTTEAAKYFLAAVLINRLATRTYAYFCPEKGQADYTGKEYRHLAFNAISAGVNFATAAAFIKFANTPVYDTLWKASVLTVAFFAGHIWCEAAMKPDPAGGSGGPSSRSSASNDSSNPPDPRLLDPRLPKVDEQGCLINEHGQLVLDPHSQQPVRFEIDASGKLKLGTNGCPIQIDPPQQRPPQVSPASSTAGLARKSSEEGLVDLDNL